MIGIFLMAYFKIVIIGRNNKKSIHSQSNIKKDMLGEFNGYSQFPQHYKELQLLKNDKFKQYAETYEH